MRDKISFVLLSHSGSPIKQITTSKNLLLFGGLLAVLLMAAAGIGVSDYLHLKDVAGMRKRLQNKIRQQRDEIDYQRKQIQTFAGEINDIKGKLVALNKLEEKIRTMANLDKGDVQENLFGVGGSIPEDLDTQLPLSEKHNSLIREMHSQAQQLREASLHQEQGLESLLDSLEDQVNLLASTPAIRPADGWISSGFGYRQSPFTGRREMHKGLDIAAHTGTPVYAPADGVVSFTGRQGGLGKVLIIDHGHGMITRYGHLHMFEKKRGEHVKRGDLIAEIGSTGRSTGPHLHYEVHLNGMPVNPNKYILN